MTQSENTYREDVFLEDLRNENHRQGQRIWAEHQEMQFSFLKRRGLRSSSTVLDLGCGPMRLGSVVIPFLNDGWYYGQDINPRTIDFGEEVLRESNIPEHAPYTLFASDQFDLSLVDRPVQIAFSNSLLAISRLIRFSRHYYSYKLYWLHLVCFMLRFSHWIWGGLG